MRRAYWPEERLLQHQNRQVRSVVKYAYDNVPFYHRRLKEAGVDPSEIRTADDLNKLPILAKDDVRKNLEQMISKEFDVARLKRLRTSGSTGKPLHFYITWSEDEFRKAKHLRANMSCGQKPWDKWVLITSPLHFGEIKSLQRLLGIFVPTPVLVFYDVGTQVSLVEQMRPDVLDGYSSSLLLLAKEVKRRGTHMVKPRLIIGGAEFIGDSSRRFIEEAFDVPFYDQYACEEMERVAWQCKERHGYHVDADSMILQFVNDGEEVSPGESGEIVCTSLFNYAMPFIRYAVGDVGVPSDEKCPCGRSLPLMKVVEGRKDSFLVLADGQVMSPFAFDAAMCLFKFHDDIDEYRVIQRKADVFEFLIKMGREGPDERTVEEELLTHLKKTLNMSPEKASFRIRFVDSIPLDKSGKLRKVVSELGQTLE